MYKPFIVLLLMFSGWGAIAQNNRNVDPCTLWGAVYIENNRNDATFRVYVEESDAFANLIVYKQNNKLFADKAGNWAFTPNRGFADFSIYIETNKALADFTIYYTPTESFAGCNK